MQTNAWRLPYQLISDDGQLIGPVMEETVGFLEAGLLGMLGAEAIIGWHLLEAVDLVIVPDSGMELIL